MTRQELIDAVHKAAKPLGFNRHDEHVMLAMLVHEAKAEELLGWLEGLRKKVEQ